LLEIEGTLNKYANYDRDETYENEIVWIKKKKKLLSI
jgi:hypothetical protein